MQTTQTESTHGEAVSPEKAPEAISKAVASLPPEQMYELIKQMKICIQVVYSSVCAVCTTCQYELYF